MTNRDIINALALGSGGGGSSVTVEPLTVTQNGTTTAPSGKAYSPVTVDVPSPNHVETISGTLSNPWGENTPLDLFAVARNGSLTMYIETSVTYSASVAAETATMMFFPISGLPTFGFTKPGISAATIYFARCAYNNSGSLGRAVAGNINTSSKSQELITLSGDTPCTLTIIHHPLPDSE